MTSERAHSRATAVIGAGPYGLSIAAHLNAAGVDTLVFGEPMGFWRHNMPNGMLLRSPWCATHLADPAGALSLDAYAAAQGVADDRPLPLEEFVAYGEWFQRHAVPAIDRRAVSSIDTTGGSFRLTLDDGEALTVNRVVVATGLRHQEYRPEAFRAVPTALASHTSEHTDFDKFRGKRVAVIGRGQSACESAALLAEAGAEAELVSRGDIRWLGAAPRKTAFEQAALRLRELLKSPSEVGPFPLSWLAEFPALARYLPSRLRDEFTRRCLKPAAAGWLRPRFADVTCTSARTIAGARVHLDKVALDLDNGSKTFDHILLGTGYRVNIERLGLFAPRLMQQISCVNGSPLLRAGLESSVPNLHFAGSYAVQSFGPLLRFVAGAPFAARTITAAARRETARQRSSTAFASGRAVYDTAAAQPAPPQ